jgi:hypothetical protein
MRKVAVQLEMRIAMCVDEGVEFQISSTSWTTR